MSHHLNHFQVSGISWVFSHRHDILSSCFCLLWLRSSLSILQHQIPKLVNCVLSGLHSDIYFEHDAF